MEKRETAICGNICGCRNGWILITEPERAERALKKLEKAFNMAYMLNKNRIVAEKEQCYNTKKQGQMSIAYIHCGRS